MFCDHIWLVGRSMVEMNNSRCIIREHSLVCSLVAFFFLFATVQTDDRALRGYETPANTDGIRIFLRTIIAAVVNV